MKSNCRPKAPLGPTGLGLPPRSHAECLVPCSQTIRSALALLHKVPLKVISTHLKLQQAPLPKKTITHTHTQTTAPNSQLWGDEVRSTAKSPHPLPSFSHFLAGLTGSPYFLLYQNPSPHSIIWLTIDDLRVQKMSCYANASCILSFIHSANIY